MDTKELRERIGQRVSWDWFGMPKGAKGKTGQGKIAYVTILLCSPLTSGNGGELIQFGVWNKDAYIHDIPLSCITKFHKRKK